ncbi:alpha/beta fold hydrolase [Caldimonas sp. KR1-144]|uniref:alpha/beta fold hydrolase n=1 Tax=Caldimonas sp. KR1-144 TaxID=3400911 RepID=UPI003C04648D
MSTDRSLPGARPANVPRRVELSLHGWPRLSIDGVEPALKLTRALALLACLAESPGQRLPRGPLAARLWPDADEALGRSRLRRLVYNLNAACGVELVCGDAHELWFAVAPRVDLLQTRAAAQALLGDAGHGPGHVQCVLAARSHALLDGFEVDSDLFEAWLAQRRAEHVRLLARAWQRLAEREAAEGDAALAVEAAERLIALDACAERAYAALITARARQGDAAAVEQAYFRCAEVLRAELGVRPSAVVERAYAAAVAQAPALEAAARIEFAQTREGAVAYTVLGGSGPTMVLVPGLLSHIEVALDEPRLRRALERLAEFSRVVLLDRRGTGLSERVGVEPTTAAAVEDIVAALDRLGERRAILFGASVGGTIAIDCAASMPERVSGLVLYGCNARGSWACDYPWAMTTEQMQRWLEVLHAEWGAATSLEAFAPSVAEEPQMRQWWARMLRTGVSQNGMAAILRAFHQMDVRDRLASLKTPTLVIQRAGDRIVREGAGRYLAGAIPGAQLVMLPGEDHWWWHGDAEAVLAAVERFVSSLG